MDEGNGRKKEGKKKKGVGRYMEFLLHLFLLWTYFHIYLCCLALTMSSLSPTYGPPTPLSLYLCVRMFIFSHACACVLAAVFLCVEKNNGSLLRVPRHHFFNSLSDSLNRSYISRSHSVLNYPAIGFN